MQYSRFERIVIRNVMEDFHTMHLSDAQMKKLNPLIRNAVYTALYSLHYSDKSDRAEEFRDDQVSMIPGYWEEPELLVEL